MTIIGTARPIGQPALSQDDTNPIPRLPQHLLDLTDLLAVKVASGEISGDELDAALALAARIEAGPPTPSRGCSPWCTRHVDATTHPGGIDPGAAHHQGDRHTVTILDGYPGRETEYELGLYLQQYDATPGHTDEPAHAYLYATADGKLNADQLRQLAAVALNLAEQLDSSGGAA